MILGDQVVPSINSEVPVCEACSPILCIVDLPPLDSFTVFKICFGPNQQDSEFVPWLCTQGSCLAGMELSGIESGFTWAGILPYLLSHLLSSIFPFIFSLI